jgi:hypothetical protein
MSTAQALPASTMPKTVIPHGTAVLPQGYKHPGAWIADLQADLDLSGREVEEITASYGKDYRMERSYYERLKSGEREPYRIGSKKLEALRVALRRNRNEWEERLGITTPTGAQLEPAVFASQVGIDITNLRPPNAQVQSLLEAYLQGDHLRRKEFTVTWNAETGYIVTGSEYHSQALDIHNPYKFKTITFSKAQRHNQMMIGAYGIRGKDVVILSTEPIEGRYEFTYRPTNAPPSTKLSVKSEDLEFLGTMIEFTANTRETS